MRLAPLLLALALGSLRAQGDAPTITGPALPGLEGADAVIVGLMQKHAVPGAQLAVARQGRLVLNHGYGFADRASRTPVQPESRFRIASLSKFITAVAILTLVEEGKLTLDAPAFALLPHLPALPDAKPDPRLASITVRQLLQHIGGWNRDASGDPMFRPAATAAATHTPAPASAEAIIRYMRGRPLDFDPGAKYAYSNFGYDVLGRIIEKISGHAYGEFVQGRVLGPAGITRLALGRTLLADRAADEVTHHVRDGAKPVKPVIPVLTDNVPTPYGGFYLEAMDAHGGWIASAADYVRFVCSLDGSRPPAQLQPSSIASMTARPAPPMPADTAAYYGFGINVRPRNGTGLGANWWHGGSLDGTVTYFVRLSSGWTWAACFNLRPQDNRGLTAELDRALNAALAASTPPADGDLFTRFTTR
ncbi:MAG: beta-lactamase family protein [Verrucomicrobia bacterium]|nr:beta-lactamase family protein [Verrucomicrobiota bacterium]